MTVELQSRTTNTSAHPVTGALVVKRDRVQVDLSELNPVRIDEQTGYMWFEGYATVAGVLVYQYLVNGELVTVRELRAPEELGQEVAKTLEGMPITEDHPPALLAARNIPATETTPEYIEWGPYLRGVVVNADSVDGGRRIKVSGWLYDPSLMTAFKSGKRELSVGATSQDVNEPGEWEGDAYHRKQTNIKFNHLAFVLRGRAGAGASARFDHEDPQEGAVETTKVTIGGHVVEVEKAHAQRVIDLAAEAEKNAATITELKTKLDEMEEKLDMPMAERLDRMMGMMEAMAVELSAAREALKELGDETTEVAEDALDQEKMDAMLKHTVLAARLHTVKPDVSLEDAVKLDSDDIKRQLLTAHNDKFATLVEGADSAKLDSYLETISVEATPAKKKQPGGAVSTIASAATSQTSPGDGAAQRRTHQQRQSALGAAWGASSTT